jgi:hypothetical protein
MSRIISTTFAVLIAATGIGAAAAGTSVAGGAPGVTVEIVEERTREIDDMHWR